MEERKTIFDYVGQVFVIFGCTIAALNIFCVWIGEDAREFSTMFSRGSEGLSTATVMQFFLVAVAITLIRFVFFTDVLIKNMSVAGRTFGMITMVLVVMISGIFCWDWFPVNLWEPWLMFALCFGLGFCVSMLVTILKERMQNRKMEEALKRLKEQEEGQR